MIDTPTKAYDIPAQETQLLMLACTRKITFVSCHFAFSREKTKACSYGISDIEIDEDRICK